MTGQQLIDRALRLIDQLPTGYTASAADSAACLASLNEMLSLWSAELVMVYQISEDQVTLDGAENYSWGPASDLTSTPPLKLLSAKTIRAEVSMPAKILKTIDEFNAILDRSATGHFVEQIFYDRGLPTCILRTWPLVTSSTLQLYGLKPLSTISALGDTIVVPDQYLHAVIHNLAVRVAPDFRRAVPELVLKEAATSKAAIAGLNVEVLGLGGTQQ